MQQLKKEIFGLDNNSHYQDYIQIEKLIMNTYGKFESAKVDIYLK